jgi:hypothetical protein
MGARKMLPVLGLIAAWSAAPAAGQGVDVLRNGGFEAEPEVAPGDFIRFSVVDGWASEQRIEYYDLEGTAQAAHEGRQCMELDELDAVAQYCRVRPGAAYTLRFAAALRPNASEDRRFEVLFDGVLLDSILVPLSQGSAWTQFEYTVYPASDPCVRARVPRPHRRSARGAAGRVLADRAGARGRAARRGPVLLALRPHEQRPDPVAG